MAHRSLFWAVSLVSALLVAGPACTQDQKQPPSATRQTQPSSAPQPGSPPESVSAPKVDPPKDIRPTAGGKIEYLEPVPMSRLVTARRAPVAAGKEVLVPLITWGGDVATILANGGIVGPIRCP